MQRSLRGGRWRAEGEGMRICSCKSFTPALPAPQNHTGIYPFPSAVPFPFGAKGSGIYTERKRQTDLAPASIKNLPSRWEMLKGNAGL